MTSAQTLEKWIRRGLLVLVAVMPFHAFLSVWLGHIAGHQALWQSWKELLLVILTALSAILVWRKPSRLRRFQNLFSYSLAAFSILAVLTTIIFHPPLT